MREVLEFTLRAEITVHRMGAYFAAAGRRGEVHAETSRGL